MRRRDFIALIGGSAFALPIAAGAQQPVPVIGYLSSGSLESDNVAARLTAFRQGLNELGYVEGQSIVIEYRWAQSQYDRLPGLAADLVRRQVAVIAAIGGAPQAVAAKAATATIPIVFTVGLDPVQLGLVASLNRPGGNITGVTSLTAEVAAKRLDLLHELVPTAAVVAVLVPTNPATTEAETRSLRDAARSRGLQTHVLGASNESEIDAAFRTLVEFRAGALVVGADPFFDTRRDQIVALAAHDAVPAMYVWREFVAAGGLISYGTDLADTMRQAGVLAGKILKGAKPADLPVQQVVKVGLVINLKTAETLGLTIPLTLSGRANEVIE
jgi:putative ABC transport system substrate-binding protein